MASRFRISAQRKVPEPIVVVAPTAAEVMVHEDAAVDAPIATAAVVEPRAARKRARPEGGGGGGGVSESKGREAEDEDGVEDPADAAIAEPDAQAIVPFGISVESQANAPYVNGIGLAPMARPVAETRHGMRQFVVAQYGVRLFIHNVVSTCNLSCDAPDLAHIATHVRNAEYNPQRFGAGESGEGRGGAEYNPQRFGAVIVRLREPKCTALFFRSGKLVVTGTKSEDDGRAAARVMGKVIHKLGFRCALADFKVQNIVASGDVGFPVRLEGLADEHAKFASYEPELFPGLVYRMVDPRLVFLIFVSGKLVCTASKSRSAIVEGMNKLYPALYKFRKATLTVAPPGLDADELLDHAVEEGEAAAAAAGPGFVGGGAGGASAAAADLGGPAAATYPFDEYEDVGV